MFAWTQKQVRKVFCVRIYVTKNFALPNILSKFPSTFRLPLVDHYLIAVLLPD